MSFRQSAENTEGPQGKTFVCLVDADGNPYTASGGSIPNPLPVTGTVTANQGLTNADPLNAWTVAVTFSVPIDVNGPIAVTGDFLTDTQLRANPVQVQSGGLDIISEATGIVIQNAVNDISSTLNDWDESNRAKVNPIVGQAGIAGGSGASDAKTTRTVTATDSPDVAVLGATTGTKVITDAAGTIQQYLRGLVYLLITPLAALVTISRKFIYNGIVTLTTTNFTGLTNTSSWQSDAIATNGASEIQFFFTTLGAAGSTALVNFYLAEAFLTGNFTDGATGTEGTFTTANRKNSRYVGSLQLNGTTAVNGMLKYTDVSGSLPERVALIGDNESGGTISATGGNTVFRYQLMN